jgi:hypothetical protein
MTDQERAARRAALTRLAVATRERLPEAREDRDAFFHVYLDGLENIHTDTFVKACRQLETTLDWFPKKHELIDACRAIARRKTEARESQQRQLTEGRMIDPPKVEELKRRVRELIATRGMK